MGLINLTGQVFGRLTVLHQAGQNKWRSVLWQCQCLCGNRHRAASGDLRQGQVKSCGCFRRYDSAKKMRKIAQNNIVHGHSGSERRSRTYRIWGGMIQRCTNPNATSYPGYGGIGITVCDRWLTFENFLADRGVCPKGLTISRFEDVGNYEPGNCAWHTWAQQRIKAKKQLAAAA